MESGRDGVASLKHQKVAELRVTGKTKFVILECEKFLEQLFLSR